MISEVVANSTWFEYLFDSDRIALLLFAVLGECVAHMGLSVATIRTALHVIVVVVEAWPEKASVAVSMTWEFALAVQLVEALAQTLAWTLGG